MPGLVVVFVPQVRDELFADHPAQGVLQLHHLDEEIIFRVQARGCHGALVVEGQPFLNTFELGSLGQVHE